MEGGISYKSVLSPDRQEEMHNFLRRLSYVCRSANEIGLDKPDLTTFIDTYSKLFFGRKDNRGGARWGNKKRTA